MDSNNINSFGASNSYRYLSVMSDGSLSKKTNTDKYKLILKIIAIIIAFGIILYILIEYKNFNSFLPDDIYKTILENYDKLIIFADIINLLTNYHIFFICFIIGFCVWNIYKSFIHILGFISIGFLVFC